MIRELTEDEVSFEIECLPEDSHPRDHFFSGDPEQDAADVADILEKSQWNPWAWCIVKITASWGGFRASEYLGGCSYEDEADFMECDYFKDMKAESLAGLNANLRSISERLEVLRVR